jgi:acyl carrier protein
VLLEAHLIDQLALVLRIDRAQIDRERPLSSIGFESLMALEYRNRLEASLGLTLPATLVWGHPTIASLAPYLADRMGLPLDGQPASESSDKLGVAEAEAPASPGSDFPFRQALEELNMLSEADALHALLAGDNRKGRQG